LNATKYFKIPYWLLALLIILAVLAILGIISAILINQLARNIFCYLLIAKSKKYDIFNFKSLAPIYLTYNDKCGSSNTCNPSKNLICQNTKCACKSSTLIWDGSTCGDFLLYSK
jgi:hypothetical protein